MATPSSGKTLDPVILALTQNRLDHISHQMGWVMVRTARSPIFSQAHDFSCFIAGPTGEVVSQADGIPIHTGSGGFGVRDRWSRADPLVFASSAAAVRGARCPR